MMSEILPQVQSIIARIAKIAQPAASDDMYNAGLASVDALELLVELEEIFALSIPDDRFVAARTPAQLAALIGALSATEDS